MVTLNEVVKTLELHKKEIFKNYNVFGSLVRGENNSNSDINMIVEYNVIPDLLKYIELESYNCF